MYSECYEEHFEDSLNIAIDYISFNSKNLMFMIFVSLNLILEVVKPTKLAIFIFTFIPSFKQEKIAFMIVLFRITSHQGSESKAKFI